MGREPRVKLQRKKRQEQGSGGWAGALRHFGGYTPLA